MENFLYWIEMEVRDYELDIQGIVNNSVYQNYLEHARHEYLKAMGLSFKKYADQGINLVVVRTELDYKTSLTSGDKFRVGVRVEKESFVKFVFYQDIYRISDNKPVLKAKVIGTALNKKGRPEIPEDLAKMMSQI